MKTRVPRSQPAGKRAAEGTTRSLEALRERWAPRERFRSDAIPLLQAALAAGLAWLVARDLVGHTAPIFAPIGALLILSNAPDTRNHFARDVGVAPNDLVGALDAFGAALERTIDLGYVNGRPFLNNVSLGIYADAVRQAGYRDAKLRTLLETAQEEALGSSSTPADVHLVDDRGAEHRSPAVVLVSNNPYAFERPSVRGARPVLDGGQLGIVVIDAPAGPPHHAGLAWSARSLRVEANGTVPAGVDGEAVALTPPLHFTIHPRALRVRLAPRHVRRRGVTT